MEELADRYDTTGARDRDQAAGILQELLAGVGEGTKIRPPIYVDYGKYLTVGARTFISRERWQR